MKYYNYDNFEKEQKYYHGTSTALNISNFLLPPTETDCIREDYRKNNRDLVYIKKDAGLKPASFFMYLFFRLKISENIYIRISSGGT